MLSPVQTFEVNDQSAVAVRVVEGFAIRSIIINITISSTTTSKTIVDASIMSH